MDEFRPKDKPDPPRFELVLLNGKSKTFKTAAEMADWYNRMSPPPKKKPKQNTEVAEKKAKERANKASTVKTIHNEKGYVEVTSEDVEPKKESVEVVDAKE